MIDTILFDLDGTLLPMDNDIFTKGYFKGLAAELIPFGYDAGTLVDAVWRGTAAMVKTTAPARTARPSGRRLKPSCRAGKPSTAP